MTRRIDTYTIGATRLARLEFPATLWRLTKDTRTARCEVRAHPLGLELRYLVDEVLLRRDVVRNTPELETHLNDSRDGFLALGWRTSDFALTVAPEVPGSPSARRGDTAFELRILMTPRTRRVVVWMGLALLAMGFSAPATAQQPFLVDDTAVTPPGIWHLELSTQVDLLQRSARPTRWQNTLECEIDYGLIDRVELSMLLPFLSIVSGGSLAQNVANGLGDTAFGLKYQFTDVDAPHAFAGSVLVELPTGSRARQLGSGLVDYGLTMISQHRLHPSATLRVNGGVVLAGNTQTGAVGITERGTVITAGGSLVGALGERVQLGGELTMAWSQRATLGGSYVGWQAGANVTLREGMTLDASVLGGWLDASPRAGFQLGLSIDLNR